MILTFSKLRELSQHIELNDTTSIIQWMNGIEGIDIFDKFKNILKLWDYNISDTLDLNVDGRSIKIQLSYLLHEFPESLSSKCVLTVDDFKVELGIPSVFNCNEDIFPIYDLIHKIEIGNITINPQTMDNKQVIIDSLPAKIYGEIMRKVVEYEDKTVKFSNPALSKLKLNFYTNDPYKFLIGLLSNYDRNYFRTVLYHLSKRLHPDVILNSNIKDVEFFIEEYQKEVKEKTNSGVVDL